MNKCPYGLKRFHALKKELRIFLTTIFQVPGMDLPEPREVVSSSFYNMIPTTLAIIFVIWLGGDASY